MTHDGLDQSLAATGNDAVKRGIHLAENTDSLAVGDRNELDAGLWETGKTDACLKCLGNGFI